MADPGVELRANLAPTGQGENMKQLLILMAISLMAFGCGDDSSTGGGAGSGGSAGSGGTAGAGGAGGDGGAGGAGGGFEPAVSKDITGACNNTFMAQNFELPITLGVTPDGAVTAGGSFDAAIVGSITLSEDFIAGILDALPTLTTITIAGGGVTVTAAGGADGDDVFSAFPVGDLDITEDPDDNGMPGPLTLLGAVVMGSYDVTGDSGTDVSFDFVGDSKALTIGTEPGESETGAQTAILAGVVKVGLPCESGAYTDGDQDPIIPTAPEEQLLIPIE